ncbi:hypothetical protein AAG604_10560 [Citromicrobium bathyomarinum]
MKKTQLYAREGVAFDETVRVRDTNGQNIDLTGYSLTLEMFQEIGDSPVFTLATDAAAGAQGLHIVEGGLRVIIDKATLNGIADDTGEFDLFGDLRGDDEGGTDYRFVSDIRLNCTTPGRDFQGSSAQITLDALGATLIAQLEALQVVDANNNAFAMGAANDNVTGVDNTATGLEASRDLLGGSGNVRNGRGAGRGNVHGDFNLEEGYASGLLITGGDNSVRLGPEVQSGYAGVSSRVTAVGAFSLRYYQGDEAVANGYNCGGGLTTGVRFTGSGAGAGATATINDAISCFGWDSDITAAARDAGYNNITVVGASAKGTDENQVALGDTQVTELRMFNMAAMRGLPTARTWYAANAGNRNLGNLGCLGIGEGVLGLSTGSTNVIGIGDLCLANHEGSNGVVAGGSRAMQESIDIKDSVVWGVLALNKRTTGVGFTIMGYRSQEHGVTSNNVTAYGDSAAWQYQGDGGVFSGYVVAELMQTGDGVVIHGRAAARHRLNGEYAILIGEEAGSFPDAPGVDIEANLGAVEAGDRVLGIGRRAIMQALGDDIVALGDLSGSAVTLGTDSIFLGSGAGADENQKADVIDTIVIGKDAYSTADHSIVLGTASNDNFEVCGVSLTKGNLQDLKELSDNATDLLALLAA